MGKLLSFVFASTALTMLVLVAISRHNNLLDDAGFVVGFVFFSLLALGTSLITAVRRVTWGNRNWRVVVRLVLLFWLPAVPALIYGLSGLRDLAAARARKRNAISRATVTPMLVGPRREVPSVERPRALVSTGERTGV